MSEIVPYAEIALMQIVKNVLGTEKNVLKQRRYLISMFLKTSSLYEHVLFKTNKQTSKQKNNLLNVFLNMILMSLRSIKK